MVEDIVEELIKRKETIASMESCTGGLFASEITNIEGSSEILKCSVVTYSNEAKIKFGVSKETIEKYSVYSTETSIEMAKKISEFTGAVWGIGITGKIGTPNLEKLDKTDNKVYFTIFNKNSNMCYNHIVTVNQSKRKDKKYEVVNRIFEEISKLLEI